MYINYINNNSGNIERGSREIGNTEVNAVGDGAVKVKGSHSSWLLKKSGLNNFSSIKEG